MVAIHDYVAEFSSSTQVGLSRRVERGCARWLGRIFGCIAMLAAVQAQAAKELDASLNLNFYPYLSTDNREADFTLNASSALPAGFSYFGFSNFRGVFADGSPHLITSEQSLRWRVPRSSFDLAVQAIISSGDGNDSWQVGPRWRLNDTSALRPLLAAVHANYSVSFFFKRFDSVPGSVQQISHSYSLRFPYLSDRLYLSGFFDHSFHRSATGARRRAVVSETQLGFRLYGRLYGIIEYRHNEYRASDKDHCAFGLEYRIEL